MKILVTGGAGFIGSHVAAAEAAAGHEVTVLDNLSSGFERNLPTKVRFILGDVLDASHILAQDSFDVVYHLAGQSSGEASYLRPLYDFNVNALGTLAVLDWANSVDVGVVVFASSMGVYGETGESERSKETDPLRPLSNYGSSKVAGEVLCRLYSSRGTKVRALRLFNVYGPGQDLNNLRQGMLSIYLAGLVRKDLISVRGPLSRIRDFVFINDVVDAMLRASRCSHEYLVANVCSGRPTTVGQAIAALVAAWDGGPLDNRIEVLPGTPYDQRRAVGDPLWAQEMLGWQATTPLMDGLRVMTEAARRDALADPV